MREKGAGYMPLRVVLRYFRNPHFLPVIWR